MWFIFGVGAIIFAVLNIICMFTKIDPKWFRFISLALTALTLCAFYAEDATRVLNKDWTGLADVVPTVSSYLWTCTMASIVINAITLFKRKK